MYNIIKNPINKKYYNINSKKGKQIIQKYIFFSKEGGGQKENIENIDKIIENLKKKDYSNSQSIIDSLKILINILNEKKSEIYIDHIIDNNYTQFIEGLQEDSPEEIYDIAVHILEKYFEGEEEVKTKSSVGTLSPIRKIKDDRKKIDKKSGIISKTKKKKSSPVEHTAEVERSVPVEQSASLGQTSHQLSVNTDRPANSEISLEDLGYFALLISVRDLGDHVFIVIMDMNCKFVGMFASNFYLHPMRLWSEWLDNDGNEDKKMKELLKTEKEKLNSVGIDIPLERFSDVWNMLLWEWTRSESDQKDYPINGLIDRVDNSLVISRMFFELCFYPNHEILSKSTDLKRPVRDTSKRYPDQPFILDLLHIMWMPNKNYKIEIPDLYPPDKSYLEDCRKIFSLNNADNRNDGFKLLASLSILALKFPQWVNHLRRALDYLSMSENHWILQADESIKKEWIFGNRLSEIAENISRQSSFYKDDDGNLLTEPRKTPREGVCGIGSHECLSNLSHREFFLNEMFCKDNLKNNGFFRKLILQTSPKDLEVFMKFAGIFDVFKQGKISMGTRCGSTALLGMVVLSLHEQEIPEASLLLKYLNESKILPEHMKSIIERYIRSDAMSI